MVYMNPGVVRTPERAAPGFFQFSRYEMSDLG